MNFKYIAMVAVIAATLVGTAAITADSALAYEKNQATSQINECSNYWFPVNVICSNLNSQAEGDENNVATTTTTPESDANFGPPFP
jgi:hypothetical protein